MCVYNEKNNVSERKNKMLQLQIGGENENKREKKEMTCSLGFFY